MEEFKPTVCVICLEVKNYENCRIIEETIKDVLDILRFKWPIEESSSMICNACYMKVFEVFRFKTLCMDTEDVIFPYVNSSNGAPVNLKEIYAKKKGKKQFGSVKDERICRLCLQIAISDCTSVRDLEVDLICRYIPEVNFNSTEEPIICTGCVDSLKTHGGFLRKHFDIHNFQNISEDETKEGQSPIKMEEIEIKSEDDDQDIDTLPPTDQSAVCKAEGEDSLETQPLTTNQSAEKCNLIHHLPKHEMLSEVHMYTCDTCSHKTKYKSNLVKHQLIHKHISDVQVYMCHTCSYKTKYKRALANHQLIHIVTSEVQMYKCHKCSFETKHKGNLTQHQLKHKDSSEVEMHKCDTCSYKSKYKRVLVRHQLKHKDTCSVQMYHCDACSYNTKYKTALVDHQLKHKDVSSVQMYNCHECSYTTKYKKALVKHQLKHKDVSQVKMYRCDKCNFATKHKENLPRHALRHGHI